MKSNTKFPTPLFSSFISNFLKLKPWKIAIFLLTLTFLPLSCKQDIDPITAEALMLQQAQEMFKTSSSARITGGSDNDLNMNEHKPDWNIRAFSKNSKKHDILNVLLKQNHNTYMQLCFIYEDGKPTMYVKSYTRDDNSLTIYSGEGKYIEKGLYDQKTGLYGRYWTKSDVAKKGRIADDPEINGGMCPEVIVWGYNNSTTSSQYLPSQATMPPSGSNSDPNAGGNSNPNGNYNPGNGYSGGTTSTTAGNFVLSVANQQQYPRFTTLVKDLLGYIQRDPKAMAALILYSGFNEQQIKDKVQFGKGPTIEVKELNGDFGYFNKSENPNVVNIDESWVRGLEQANLTSTQQATAFLLAVTILHEFVHQARNTNDLPRGPYEFGNGFELQTYGIIINGDNASNYSYRFYKK